MSAPWVRSTPDDGPPHRLNDACWARGCKPVAIIDPEDAEQVERLVDAVSGSCGYSASHDVAFVAAALREFAAPSPPKPAEPQGLGAVVEDAEGLRWVRANRIRKFPWETRGEDGGYTWAGVDAVRVLSEGVGGRRRRPRVV